MSVLEIGTQEDMYYMLVYSAIIIKVKNEQKPNDHSDNRKIVYLFNGMLNNDREYFTLCLIIIIKRR